MFGTSPEHCTVSLHTPSVHRARYTPLVSSSPHIIQRSPTCVLDSDHTRSEQKQRKTLRLCNALVSCSRALYSQLNMTSTLMRGGGDDR